MTSGSFRSVSRPRNRRKSQSARLRVLASQSEVALDRSENVFTQPRPAPDMPQDPTGELDRRSEFPAFATDRSEPQQRDVTHRLMITRLRSGAISMAIISRRSASLMAARTFALPTLARSAIRATGRAHFPVAAASFRMTASKAIASVFRSSLIEGGTTTVAARNRRPHATRWAVSDLLRFSTIRVSITTSLRRSGPS